MSSTTQEEDDDDDDDGICDGMDYAIELGDKIRGGSIPQARAWWIKACKKHSLDYQTALEAVGLPRKAILSSAFGCHAVGDGNVCAAAVPTMPMLPLLPLLLLLLPFLFCGRVCSSPRCGRSRLRRASLTGSTRLLSSASCSTWCATR